MGTKTFNIDDGLYENFSKLHKGDMSKIMSQLIQNYLSIKKENLQLEKLKENLSEIEQQIVKLKQEESNIKLFISQLEEEYKKEVEKAKEVDYKVLQWARDMINDAKVQGSYTDLVYECENNGFSDVEAYLVDKWEKSQK